MSRSNNTTSTNPTTRWFEWSGSTGQLKYYDRDKQENVFIDAPFTFLVLDQLSTITGWSDDAQSGVWANEVRNLQLEELIVRTKMGILARGQYSNIKGLNGVRFTKSIYIAYYDDNKQLQIGNLKAAGACLSAWIEFSRGRDVYKGAVTLSKAEPAKKGATKYFIPVFEEKTTVSDETNAQAVELDKQLQAYLNDYFADQFIESPSVDTTPFSTDESEITLDDDEIPF